MQNLIPGGASSKKATSCSISTLVRRQYNLWIIVIPLPFPTSPSSSVLIIEMRHNLWETYMLSTLCPELCILFWKKLNFCKVLTWSTFLCDKKTQLAKDKQIKNKKKEGNKPKKKKSVRVSERHSWSHEFNEFKCNTHCSYQEKEKAE